MKQVTAIEAAERDRGASPWKDDGLRPLAERRAVRLGYFSLGLGAAQLLFPGKVAELIGLRNATAERMVMRAIGVREILSGLGLLNNPRSSGWLFSRLLGDAMDVALLGSVLSSGRTERGRTAAATAAVLGVAAVDMASAARLSRSSLQSLVMPVHVKQVVTINRSPAEVYSFFRDLENLPRFMEHLESVQVSNGTSTWRAKAPAHLSVEWKAEIIRDVPHESIAWRSLPGTLVPNRGVVRFQKAAGDRGTQVLVELKYDPPGGAMGAAFARLFGEEPSQQIKSDLRRLKQILETGEVVHSDASIHRGRHPARPSESDDTVAERGKP
jgi:uncharacterized membrane protein